MFNLFKLIVTCFALVTLASAAKASDMVYTPVNPTFGGNPNNASGLLATAQSQNSYKAPVDSPLVSFSLSLQRAILSRLTSQTLTTMFGKDSVLTPGNYDTVGFTIQVVDSGNGILTINTTDKNTGAVTSFQISSAGT